MGAALAALAALALVAAGCGGAGGGSSAGILTLYSGQHPETTAALVKAFETRTRIQVAVRNNDEDVLVNQIVEEGGHSPADLVYTENSPALELLQEKGLLAPVDPATLAAVPGRLDSPRGDWVGVSARVSVLVYNTSRLSRAQLPTSVLDLARPRWKGLLALAPSETDFQPVVASVAHRYGKAAALRWLRGLKANAASHLYPDNETVTSEVNKGHAAIGIIDHYYWWRLRADLGSRGMHSAIAFLAPRDPGYVLDVSGAAVLRSSPHRVEAERFLAFLVSADGQEILAHSDSYEYPIGSGISTAQPLAPFSGLRPTKESLSSLGDGSEAVSLLQQAQLL
jgi:iron(III) transport system substrate-binding protein